MKQLIKDYVSTYCDGKKRAAKKVLREEKRTADDKYNEVIDKQANDREKILSQNPITKHMVLLIFRLFIIIVLASIPFAAKSVMDASIGAFVFTQRYLEFLTLIMSLCIGEFVSSKVYESSLRQMRIKKRERRPFRRVRMFVLFTGLYSMITYLFKSANYQVRFVRYIWVIDLTESIKLSVFAIFILAVALYAICIMHVKISTIKHRYENVRNERIGG